jgi:hypothetical protein
MTPSRMRALAAVIAVIATAVLTGLFRLRSPDALPRCLDSPLIAFETAQSPQEAAAIWNQLGDTQPNVAKGLYADFSFIASYTFLFLVLAGIATGRSVMFSHVAGTLAMISAIVTAAADVGENVFAITNIAALRSGLLRAEHLALMRECSLTKWVACGITLILFWWTFVPSRRGSALYRFVSLTVAVFAVISGSLAVLGLWDNAKIQLVISFLAPALVLQIPLFWFFWNDVIGVHAEVGDHPIETWGIS